MSIRLTAAAFAEGLVACVLAAGCAPTYQNVDLPSVLEEGRKNQVGVTLRLENQHLRVSGIVQNVGMHKQKHIEVELTSEYHATGRSETDRYVFAFLLPNGNQSQGKALCFFSDRSRQQAAELEPGQPATLEGEFQELAVREGVPFLVLKGCGVARE